MCHAKGNHRVRKLMQPLLRWAGSKKRQFGVYSPHFPRHFVRYLEPFTGSAAFAFRLSSPQILLNDINIDLVDFYNYAGESPAKLYDVFTSYERSAEAYYEIRKTFNGHPRSIERSAMFYYLNRNCFTGIYRLNRSGEFNVPFSDSRVSPYLTRDQFLASSDVISKAIVSNGDFEVFCRSNVKAGDFLFIDPIQARENLLGGFLTGVKYVLGLLQTFVEGWIVE